MKVKGTDEIVKLLLEMKVAESDGTNIKSHEILEKTTQKVEEAILRKDEFIPRDQGNHIKAEVQFTKSLHESPEAYLHRISSEVIKLRENMNMDQPDSSEMDDSNTAAVETAIRSGLLKDFTESNGEKKREVAGESSSKWLYRLVVVFSLVLMAYFFLIQ